MIAIFPTTSSHDGQAVLGFPDVCWVPALPGQPVPMPFPNLGMATGAKKTNATPKPKIATKPAYATKSTFTQTRGNEAGMLRGHLSVLHQRLMTMPAGNPTQWHAVLDEYVMTAAAVYSSLTSNRG
ncbi:MAG: DUF4150 domain-containing protein [Inquilinus sp.]|nr:DUF4150 domain-containing protein [Inquilinus sp.]